VVKRPAELACLLAVRNRLAAAVAHREMPPLAEEKRQCNWCFQRANCALAFRAEGGEGATADAFVGGGGGRRGQQDRVQAELAAKYEQAAGHMTQQGELGWGGGVCVCVSGGGGGGGPPKPNFLQKRFFKNGAPQRDPRMPLDWQTGIGRQGRRLVSCIRAAAPHPPHPTPDCEFLRKWEGLVTLEEAHSCARRPEIWAMPGPQRQLLGRCVAGLALSVGGAASMGHARPCPAACASSTAAGATCACRMPPRPLFHMLPPRPPQHVDEEQLLYSFCRPDGAALDCGFQQGDMLVLSVEGGGCNPGMERSAARPRPPGSRARLLGARSAQLPPLLVPPPPPPPPPMQASTSPSPAATWPPPAPPASPCR
jgi:hypothetical protein